MKKLLFFVLSVAFITPVFISCAHENEQNLPNNLGALMLGASTQSTNDILETIGIETRSGGGGRNYRGTTGMESKFLEDSQLEEAYLITRRTARTNYYGYPEHFVIKDVHFASTDPYVFEGVNWACANILFKQDEAYSIKLYNYIEGTTVDEVKKQALDIRTELVGNLTPKYKQFLTNDTEEENYYLTVFEEGNKRLFISTRFLDKKKPAAVVSIVLNDYSIYNW